MHGFFCLKCTQLTKFVWLFVEAGHIGDGSSFVYVGISCYKIKSVNKQFFVIFFRQIFKVKPCCKPN